MALYFFDIHDGADLPDNHGSELGTLEEVRSEAIRVAAHALEDKPGRFWTGERWYVDVRDEAGATLFKLAFSADDPNDDRSTTH